MWISHFSDQILNIREKEKQETSSEGSFKFPILWYCLNDINPKLKRNLLERYKNKYEIQAIWPYLHDKNVIQSSQSRLNRKQ